MRVRVRGQAPAAAVAAVETLSKLARRQLRATRPPWDKLCADFARNVGWTSEKTLAYKADHYDEAVTALEQRTRRLGNVVLLPFHIPDAALRKGGALHAKLAQLSSTSIIFIPPAADSDDDEESAFGSAIVMDRSVVTSAVRSAARKRGFEEVNVAIFTTPEDALLYLDGGTHKRLRKAATAGAAADGNEDQRAPRPADGRTVLLVPRADAARAIMGWYAKTTTAFKVKICEGKKGDRFPYYIT